MNTSSQRLVAVACGVVCLAVGLQFPQRLLGCLQEYTIFSTTDLAGNTRVVKTIEDGSQSDSRSPWKEFAEQFQRRPSRERLEERRQTLFDLLKTEPNFRTQNDLAVVLIRLGQPDEALSLLADNEATQTGEYHAAANLGVAYELAGDLDKALHWVRQGMARNPESHRGTEWLHVRILEVRKELTSDEARLANRSVLGLNFGAAPVPTKCPDAELSQLAPGLTMESLRIALEHQLVERTSLVPPPNAVVADLFFDLANVLALNGQVEKAVEAMKQAREYGSPTRNEFAKREMKFTEIAKFQTSTSWGAPPTNPLSPDEIAAIIQRRVEEQSNEQILQDWIARERFSAQVRLWVAAVFGPVALIVLGRRYDWLGIRRHRARQLEEKLAERSKNAGNWFEGNGRDHPGEDSQIKSPDS